MASTSVASSLTGMIVVCVQALTSGSVSVWETTYF